MEIIFQGNQSTEEAVQNLVSIVRLFRERYGIENFREMHLSLTLLDNEGEDVELVDNNTAEVFRVFEVYRTAQEAVIANPRANIRLVVDNTK